MPTATSTITTKHYSTQLPLKSSIVSSPLTPSAPSPTSPSNRPSSTTTAATLRTLYNRAARAFLLRDIPLTYSLLESAFALIQPPSSTLNYLNEQRRKWDILRITLETTVYASPPPAHDDFPEALRANLTESPQALLTSIYTRSCELFTPATDSSAKFSLNAAHLPSAVLITLVYSSLKIDCADVGRVMIEDWLAHREPPLSGYSSSGSSEDTDGEGYHKILELYCLHVLPRLEQWDYSKEFLEYEIELPVQSREHLKTSLQSLYAQTMESRRPPKKSSISQSASSSTSTPRPYSPAPSSSSSSSSLSTTSTHTIVPSTPRGNRGPYTPSGLTSLAQASASSTSLSSDTTATPRGKGPSKPGGRPSSRTRTAHSRTSTTHSQSSGLSLPRAPFQAAAVRPGSPSTYALIKASLAPYLTTSRLTTLFVLFVLFPLVSFALRLRRRRRLQGVGAASVPGVASNVEIVRRRLQASGAEVGVVGAVWREVVRAISDTVRMAGSGLV